MELVKPTDLTLRPARITHDRFKQILSEQKSPALPYVDHIWTVLIDQGVDPSFALAHFQVESLYGKAGHAKVTHSWGNILWDAAWTPNAPKYAPGNGYTYAVYDNFGASIVDYAAYVNRYAVTADARYGGITDTIDEATARWTGAGSLTDAGHLRYVSIMLNNINTYYEYVPNTFVEVGDKMIQVGSADVKTSTRYPVKNGTALYRGTNGDLLKYASFGNGSPSTVGLCRFLGPVGQPWSDKTWAWGAVIVGTSTGGSDPLGNIVYIQNPDPKKVVKG